VNQLTALASSSLNTTIDDFSLWMENYETAQVGGREIIDRMTERGVLTGGDTIAYAFGLTVGEYRGLSNFGHGGSWAGYRTNFLRFPEQDLSVAVFCNFSTCDPGRRAVEAAEVYLESLMQPAERVGPDRRQSEPVSLSAAQLAEYTGQFRSPELDSTYDLFVEDGALVAKHWRGAPIGFSPTGEDTFTSEHPWFPEVRFIRDGRGRVTSFTVTGVRVRHLLFELR